MTESDWKEFTYIAEQCRQGEYRSINVGGKARSAVIVAVYEFVKDELDRRKEGFKNKVKQELTAP